MRKPMIVGIGGTTRPDSLVERLARAVLGETENLGAETLMFGGLDLANLPHFAADSDARTTDQERFIQAVRSADGIVIGSPGYHGGISGLVKNAIDLIEDTRRDERPYLDGLPIALVVCAAGWQAGGVTLAALRNVAHALRGWPTPTGIAVNTIAQSVFSPSGEVADAGVRAAVVTQAGQMMQLARISRRRSNESGERQAAP